MPSTIAPPLSSTLQDIQFLRSRPLAHYVQREIERQILSGALQAGERLNELDIARRLGISRAPVRESLRSLAEAGLVTIRKNFGVYVRVVSLEEAREIYQVRSYIDAGVGRELARRIRPAEIAELRKMAASMEDAYAARDANAYYELNVAFHERMVEIAGNRKLLELYRKLLNELTLYRRRSLGRRAAMRSSQDEHRHILAAIAAGNSDAAGNAMRNHILASSERLQRTHERLTGTRPARRKPHRLT